MGVLFSVEAFTPMHDAHYDQTKWTAGWVFRAHLPWDFIREIDVGDWLLENCSGKYDFKPDPAFSYTYLVFIEQPDDATHFTLRWVNFKN